MRKLFGRLLAALLVSISLISLAGCGGSDPTAKDFTIYLSGADSSKTWNVWAWIPDVSTYNTNTWPGGDIQLTMKDTSRNLVYTIMEIDATQDLGILFVASSGSPQTADIVVPSSVLMSTDTLYFDYTSKDYYTSFDQLKGINYASITGVNELTVKFLGDPSSNAADYTVKNSEGTALTVSTVSVSGKKAVLSLTGGDLSKAPYTITYGGTTLSADISPDLIDSEYNYENNDLGVTVSGTKASFKCWAPKASAVTLLLYTDASSLSTPAETVEMTKGEKGVWAASNVSFGSNKYYKYRIVNGSSTKDVSDIWSVCASGDSVASQIVNINDGTTGVAAGAAETYDGSKSAYVNPFGSNGTEEKRYSDAVIYEMHIRDWSRAYVSDSTGKFQDITAALNKNTDSFADYLKDLGITHVQILPMFDYSQKNSDTGYNWGYNPYHYNVPEGRYVNYGTAKDGTDAVLQMREMIEAFHKNGIAVIMDVVYNHTSGTGNNSLYDMTVPEYFYRLNEKTYINGSGCGNEIATNHEMARKYVVESLKHWMLDYHINGFRFDLMGCLETSTMKEIYEALYEIDQNVLVYGEPWTGGSSGVVRGATAAAKTATGIGFGAFDDEFRNAVKGGEFGGFAKGQVQGAYADDKIINGLRGNGTSRNETELPELEIHYVECHDNYTLFDKLVYSTLSSTTGDLAPKFAAAYSAVMADSAKLNKIKAQEKLSAAYVFLAQGTPFINGGQEFMRTKKGNPDSYSADKKGGISWTNTPGEYNIDDVNTIDLSFVTKYADVYNTYRGLIHLRKDNSASFGNRKDAAAVKLEKGVTKYTAGDFVVYFNATETAYTVADGAEGYVVSIDDTAKTTAGYTIASAKTTVTSVPAGSFVIIKK